MSMSTQMGELIEELRVSQRDLKALRTFVKDSVESTTGFSFDAIACLLGKAADALEARTPGNEVREAAKTFLKFWEQNPNGPVTVRAAIRLGSALSIPSSMREADARDMAYVNGAKQMLAIALQSMDEAQRWADEGYGNRIPPALLRNSSSTREV